MKKTNVTSIQPSSWITSRGGQYMQWVLTSLLLLFGVNVSMAQGPNCTDINASLQADGYVEVLVGEFVTNCDDAEPVDVTVYNQYGGLVQYLPDAACDDVVEFYACNAIGQTYKVSVSNSDGTCWSELTFKQSNGPLLEGNTYYLYCLEEEVGDVYAYLDRFYGNYDGTHTYDEYPEADIPCFGTEYAQFVADWVDPYPCVLGEDTAKIIYREFEAFDKNGNRGSTFDTIYVWRLPQITVNNIYCAEKDTLYCGVSAGYGPYIVVDGIDSLTGMPNGECDTLCLVTTELVDGELDIVAKQFDPKCGITLHVDAWKFEDHCSPQWKVTLELKQDCYGAVDACVVTPPAGGPGTANAFEEIAPGYWRCTYWVIDYDTVPPIAEVKYDKIQEQNLAWPEFCLNQEQHGQGDPIHCYPTPTYPGSAYDAPVIIVPASSHDCAAHTYIPPLCVYDDWSGIKQVKARIDGIGAWVLEGTGEECDELDSDDLYCEDHDYDVTGYCYESHQTVKLPKSEYPYRVMYEIYDYCHNIDTVYGYILVKDQTKPVAVADKGVTVSLSDKKVWVDAYTFDEGSWDNCGVNFILARRSDWYEFCIDLCDDYTKCFSGYHGDTLYMPRLEEDKHVDEVEAHYAKTLEWLCYDGVPCGDLVYNAWLYDLMKYTTLHCIDHPYPVDNKYFRHLFEDFYAGNGYYYDCDPSEAVEYCYEKFKLIYPYFDPGCVPHVGGGFMTQPVGGAAGAVTPGYELSSAELRQIDKYEQIGGGWSKEVPFDCTDACGPVTVEILVMDYWCNWSKAWTDVWVEDKTPVTVGKDVVEELEITCATYKEARYGYGDEVHKVSLEYLVNAAKEGDEIAYDSLDAILGGYCKAWKDPYGNYVDADGEEIDCDIDFYDKYCYCEEIDTQIRVYDEHFGYIWKDSVYTKCYYEDVHKDLYKGIVVVNCEENVYCEQDIWCEFDHCGQGYIFRKFKIWQGCPPEDGYGSSHTPDTIYRHQRIWVGNTCELDKYMFDVPYDQTVYSCGIEYDEDGSGNVSGAADPEFTGYPEYKFDDDCRIVGIAHEDKVFKVVGGDEGCYKIVRTWYFADWCGGKPVDPLWWRNREFVYDYCVQKILVVDTIPPVCTITGPVDEGGTIEAGGCDYTFNASVNITDACGVIEYSWQLKEVKGSDAEVVAEGYGDLNSEEEDNIDISVEGLATGTYKLVVTVTDECQNESYCEYNFDIVTGKKPAPICVTSLTAELNPWDTNGDGTIDTAVAVVWAYEFNSSSAAPCGEDDDDLVFYAEILGDGVGDADTVDMDILADSITVGCEHAGSTQMVRMWVISESGAADYCDVLLVVQNNMDGCGDISSQAAVTGVITTELDDKVEQVQVTATLDNGQVVNGITTATGAYTFATALGARVTVTPKKDIGADNGVSTLDLVKIQKHILRKSLLETQLREVAADANNDGKISALDLLEIRKLILGKTDRFANVDSWRFFSELDNQESYVIDGINGVMQIDWTGVKIGDVDNSMDPSRSASRTGKSLVFNVSDAQMIAGNQYRVDFRANNFDDITGYQFTLNFDQNALNVLNVESGALEVTGDNFGLNQVNKGIVTTSWNTGEGMSIDQNEVVFSLIVEAKNGANLSDVMTVSSRVTSAEAYNSADQIHDVSLNFEEGKAVEVGFALYQNEPNPFKETTQVGFNLPESMSATVTVYDVTGKVVKVVEGDYSKGYNEVTFKRADLKATGVLYYQLDTEAFTATKKMIVIE